MGSPPASPPHVPDSPRARIVAAARRTFLAHGFARTTMDEIAGELGMSKKTLYAHFRSKDALVAAVVESKTGEFVAGLDALVTDPSLAVADRVQGIMAHVTRQMSEVSPAFLHDLQRHLPALYARIEAIRAENLPRVWTRLLEDGIKRGHVRGDVDPRFAATMILACAQTLLHPDALARLNLAPSGVITRILTTINTGILTPAGLKAYETRAT